MILYHQPHRFLKKNINSSETNLSNVQPEFMNYGSVYCFKFIIKRQILKKFIRFTYLQKK